MRGGGFDGQRHWDRDRFAFHACNGHLSPYRHRRSGQQTSTLTNSRSLGIRFAGEGVTRNQAAFADVTQFRFRALFFNRMGAWVTGFDAPCTVVNVSSVGAASKASPLGTRTMVKKTSRSRWMALGECFPVETSEHMVRDDNAMGMPTL